MRVKNAPTTLNFEIEVNFVAFIFLGEHPAIEYALDINCSTTIVTNSKIRVTNEFLTLSSITPNDREHLDHSCLWLTRIDLPNNVKNQLQSVGNMVANMASFRPAKSTTNIEIKHPKAIPNLNNDTIQEASSLVILKVESSAINFGIIGDVHPSNIPTVKWAKLAIFVQHFYQRYNPRNFCSFFYHFSYPRMPPRKTSRSWSRASASLTRKWRIVAARTIAFEYKLPNILHDRGRTTSGFNRRTRRTIRGFDRVRRYTRAIITSSYKSRDYETKRKQSSKVNDPHRNWKDTKILEYFRRKNLEKKFRI